MLSCNFFLRIAIASYKVRTAGLQFTIMTFFLASASLYPTILTFLLRIARYKLVTARKKNRNLIKSRNYLLFPCGENKFPLTCS